MTGPDPADPRRVSGPLVDRLTATLGRPLSDELFVQALTHRSYAYENGGLPTNERLEFLGDSVLGLVVTDTLFAAHPDLPEGQLAKLRAAVVNARALADVGRGLGLGAHLWLGKGEEATGGRDKSSILADTVEALIGAVYLERGLDGASTVIHAWFDPLVAQAAELGAGLDWKTSLQELSADLGLGLVSYEVEGVGPDHLRTFTAQAVIAGQVRGTGTGSAKKIAEQDAAAAAYGALHAVGGQAGAGAGDGGSGAASGAGPDRSGAS